MRWLTSSDSSIRYLALGDSYTAGTGASSTAHSWPSIIAERWKEQTGQKVKLTNPAVGGFTTLDLIARELSLVRRTRPDLITILIGVNDLVQGRTADDYRASLATIYDEVDAQKPPGGRVFAISLPNWSVVPAARQFGDPEEIRDLTDNFNDAANEAALARGFGWIDITAASLSGLGTAGWIAADGLHPADRQYAAWAEVIWHSVRPG
ncbi:MAG: SGNH/GDSL hydrolase family protein [Candidatus Dormibacteraceae bacterium]